MNDFAKIFHTPKYGQVLMLLKADEEGKPRLCFFMKPNGLDVCNIALGFDEWDDAEKAFEEANDDIASQLAEALFLSIHSR